LQWHGFKNKDLKNKAQGQNRKTQDENTGLVPCALYLAKVVLFISPLKNKFDKP
jgi:hypothetical protein